MSVLKSPGRLAPHHKPMEIARHNEYLAWQDGDSSALRLAAAPVLKQATQLANDNELLVTLTDQNGQLLWTCAHNPLQASLLDSVCCSAPIIHPQSGELYGVLSLSMGWKGHSSAGEIVAASLAYDIAQQLPHHEPCAELEIHALGRPWVLFRGKTLHLSPRMIEILCILALNPEGLTLEACHAALYGDVQVTTTTLKAELSHLRTLLDGSISSRTYRLLGTVWVDFIELWTALRLHQNDVALSLYSGELLPASQSPEIREWRTCIKAVMDFAFSGCISAKTYG